LKSIFALLLLLLSAQVLAVQSKTLSVASDEWCPYICNNKSLPGFLVELLQDIAENNDIQLKFSLIPLSRALALTETGKLDIVLAISPQQFIGNNLQRSRLTFGISYNDFYVRRNEHWQFRDITSLHASFENKKTLGVISGYKYGQKLDQALKQNKENIHTASGDGPLLALINMLKLGRIDIILDSRFAIQYELSKSPQSNIIYAGSEGSFTPLYLGFSPHISKEIVNIFDNGIIDFRRNGKLAAILAKYGIKDWILESTAPVQ
tara:strand:+ start:382 stop:1173 length:792 start_codon:yes stop_codon:yes gene_type:complete